jgi:hypothetical protein
MSAKKLAEHFSELEDPRCSGKVEHLLIDILVIAVCAVIAGAESWVDMALYGQNKADWLSTFLRLPNGIPAHDTFRRVFMLINPEDFESRFTAWTQAFAVSVDREVVAIDGKTVRGSFDRSRETCDRTFLSAKLRRVGAPSSPPICELFLVMMMSANRLGLQWNNHVMGLGRGLTAWAMVPFAWMLCMVCSAACALSARLSMHASSSGLAQRCTGR